VLHIVNVEEIQGLLLRVPALIDRLERRDANFAQAVVQWLTAAEQVFVNNRLPLAGNLAALRGVLGTAGVTAQGRPTPRKLRAAAAADALRQAADLITAAVREDDARIAEADRLCQQMLAMAHAAGLLAAPTPSVARGQWLREVWKVLAADPNLAAGAVRITGLVGPHDALIVLDRALARDAQERG
jgi:hypothetical protein